MQAPSINLGDMYWGKSESYPWWPCVIIKDLKGSYIRFKRRIGYQYHAQFIGPEYDVCWITDEFLIKYAGTKKFEEHLEQKIFKASPNSKHIYSMQMSNEIKEMWIEACKDAEKFFFKSSDERISMLPKSNLVESNNIITRKAAQRSFKRSYKRSSSETSDCAPLKREKEVKETNTKPMLGQEIEEKCKKAFIIHETINRIKNSTNSDYLSRDEIEDIVKTQWNALDSATKLLYLNDESAVSILQQSKVSGRKIKVPCRLRSQGSSDDSQKIDNKKLLIPASETETETKPNSSADLNSKIEKVSSMTSIDSIYKETMDFTFLHSLSVKDCTTEMMKNVLTDIQYLPFNACYSCFQVIEPKTKYVKCRGKCEAIYHLHCAVTKKLFRSEDVYNCVNCLNRASICCICKNSKYMKRQFLLKCQVETCGTQFHPTCLKFLNFTENSIEENESIACPNHSCLTCTREDVKHQCNTEGTFVSCIKCPVSFHANSTCIAAGSRLLNNGKIICYRHEEVISTLHMRRVKKCFICYQELATLRCCRCRAVFHPKCMGMPTYTDLLKDYACPSCKLEKPIYHGEVVWVNYKDSWHVGEVVGHGHVPKEFITERKCIYIKLIDKYFYFCVNRCEIITFKTGLNVLSDQLNLHESIIKRAKLLHLCYLNWRKRLYPFTKELVKVIGKYDLLKYSITDTALFNIVPKFEDNYQRISANIYNNTKLNQENGKQQSLCFCSTNSSSCSDVTCKNFANKVECDASNCSLKACPNRKFAHGPCGSFAVENSNIDGKGIKIIGAVRKDNLLGECVGCVVSANQLLDLTHNRSWKDSSSYLVHLKSNEFLDFENFGNEWRFLNHSCEPNCILLCWTVGDKLRLGVFTLRDVVNEELTIDYNKSKMVLKFAFICKCGSTGCTEVVGPTSIFLNQCNFIVSQCCILNEHYQQQLSDIPVKSLSSSQQMMAVNLYKEQKPSLVSSISNLRSLSDTQMVDKITCFQCGNGGEMMCCNKNNCYKLYHLHCVEISEVPTNIWYCPLHFCHECGKLADSFCNECPTSHCSAHSHLQKSHICKNNLKVELLNPKLVIPTTIKAIINTGKVSCKLEEKTKQNLYSGYDLIKIDRIPSQKSLDKPLLNSVKKPYFKPIRPLKIKPFTPKSINTKKCMINVYNECTEIIERNQEAPQVIDNVENLIISPIIDVSE